MLKFMVNNNRMMVETQQQQQHQKLSLNDQSNDDLWKKREQLNNDDDAFDADVFIEATSNNKTTTLLPTPIIKTTPLKSETSECSKLSEPDMPYEFGNEFEDEEAYGIMKPNIDCSLDTVVKGINAMSLRRNHKKGSFFDSCDYDEVIEFMESPTPLNNNFSTPKPVKVQGSTEDIDSKRSSAASTSSSGVESSGENNNCSNRRSKYGDADIAKILRTRKRIHQSLHAVPIAVDKESSENAADSNASNNTSASKRLSAFSKRYPQFGGTLGRRTTKRNSDAKRYSVSSRPHSGNDFDLGEMKTIDRSFRSPYSSIAGEPNSTIDSGRTLPKSKTWTTEQKRMSNCSSVEGDNSNAPKKEKENKPWNRRKWGSFRMLRKPKIDRSISQDLNKSDAPYTSDNNNSVFDIPQATMSRGELSSREKKMAQSLSYNCFNPDLSDDDEVAYQPRGGNITSSAGNTNSLLRRFSRKSSSTRSKSASGKQDTLVKSATLSTLQPSTPKFQYGAGESLLRSPIETQVLTSLEERHGNSATKKEDESSGKTNTLKRRFLSMTRKRTASFRIKRFSKIGGSRKSSTAADAMNKTLSISSPQLSVYNVNSVNNSSNPSYKNRASMRLDF